MSLVKITQDDRSIVTLTLARPEKRNALSLDLINDLESSLREIAGNDGHRVMILAGEGASFCAGMDLKGVLDDAKRMSGMLHGLSRAMRSIRRLSIPTIAQVQGAAVGGGCGLAVVCDYAVTHPEAKLGYPEVELGVCPAVVAPWLIRRIGAGRARSLLLAGGTMSGTHAIEIGLVDEIVEQDQLEQRCLEFATKLSKGGRQAMSITKHWLNELEGSLEDASFEKAAQISADVIVGEEAQERLGRIFGSK
ncbi:MAG: enoyl-CoA hydratase [Phycisphaerae bacterium]|nr:enoyl-CoA hydratase [Phycisphaerae bacterium]|tara:strand:- start:743 stop:1492 length:750 start_codon:yes stop_codon:yes gene_type:complete